MSKLKTFLIYFLIVLAFFIFSTILENVLIKQMYNDMSGTVNDNFIYSSEIVDIDITVTEAKATNRNGYVDLTITNNSNTYIAEAYVRVKLYTKSDVLAIDEYMEISGLSGGEERTYTLSFRGSYIRTYQISMENDYPDKDYTVNVFGYDVNTKDIFGMDLSEEIDTQKLAEFSESPMKFITTTAYFTTKAVPWWGWFWAWCIIVGVW